MQTNTRKPAPVKVKLGPAEGTLGYGRSMPILARVHRHHDWQTVGWVEVEADYLGHPFLSTDSDLRVSAYSATLALDLPYSAAIDLEDCEHSVDVMVPVGRRASSMKPIRTAAEAKRMVKAWAAETLESVGWGL